MLGNRTSTLAPVSKVDNRDRSNKRGMFMACLTRNLQKALSRYIQVNIQKPLRMSPEQLREMLVDKGICPSDVTTDQMAVILKSIDD